MARLSCSLLASLWLFLVSSASSTRPPFYPYRDDNVLPAFANPAHNVSCVGEADDLGEHLPIHNGFDPNGVSMQKLCVKPQFGGGQIGQHLGGFCQPPPDAAAASTSSAPPPLGRVAFDPSPAAITAKWLRNPRLLLHCRSRCFCNYGIPEAQRNVQPKEIPADYGTELRRGNAYRIEIDVVDDHVNAVADSRAVLDHWAADSVARKMTKVFDGEPEVPPFEDGMNLPPMPVSITRANQIECEGPLPEWPAPPPFTWDDFTDLRSLCATQLSGGNPAANAGGYCHRDPLATGGRRVWFADAFTPRLDWTFTYALGPSLAIRSYCHSQCHCKAPKKKERHVGTKVWRFVEEFESITMEGGSMQLYRTGSSSGDSLLEILPSQTEEQPSSGTCGADGRQFCVKSWPTALLGPVPRKPPAVRASAVPKPPAPPAQCGTTCTTQKECKSTDPNADCACIAPTFAEARKAGLDQIFPQASCLVIAAEKFSEGLMGRDVDAQSEEPACVCNSTYISQGCCSSEDGMIWEDGHRKLGKLAPVA
ncbi:MAG: hypothetical protein M1817_000799 [Caeruleum heppii]|nr:MAG: hypothetical protein M1817_000799 [Caeruleum heppii]